MSLKSIRDRYAVPAYRGAPVAYTHTNDKEILGKILSSDGSHIYIRFEDGTRHRHHPTWHIEYLDESFGDDK